MSSFGAGRKKVPIHSHVGIVLGSYCLLGEKIFSE